MIAFPLPPGLSTSGTAVIAPRKWGCHSCATVIRRETCCQRVSCWRFDDRGLATSDRLDAPCDVPADHCARCCSAASNFASSVSQSCASGRAA